MWVHEFQSVPRTPNKAHGDVQRWCKVGKNALRSKEGDFKPSVRDALHKQVDEAEVVTPGWHRRWEQRSTDEHPPSEPLIRDFYSKYNKDSDSLNR